MGSKKQEKSKALIPRWLHCFHALLHLQPEPYIALARTHSCAIMPQGWVLGCLHLARGRPQRLTLTTGFRGRLSLLWRSCRALARCHFWLPQPTRQGYSPWAGVTTSH